MEKVNLWDIEGVEYPAGRLSCRLWAKTVSLTARISYRVFRSCT